jgi:hypothetical protein
MCLYYIAMEFMFWLHKYFLTLLIFMHNDYATPSTMNLTQTPPKPFKTKSLNPFTILFHQTLHSYNKNLSIK